MLKESSTREMILQGYYNDKKESRRLIFRYLKISIVILIIGFIIITF